MNICMTRLRFETDFGLLAARERLTLTPFRLLALLLNIFCPLSAMGTMDKANDRPLRRRKSREGRATSACGPAAAAKPFRGRRTGASFGARGRAYAAHWIAHLG